MTVTDARAPRLLELARKEAFTAHRAARYAASNGHPDQGHTLEPFESCPHPDCAALREAERAQPGMRWSDKASDPDLRDCDGDLRLSLAGVPNVHLTVCADTQRRALHLFGDALKIAFEDDCSECNAERRIPSVPPEQTNHESRSSDGDGQSHARIAADSVYPSRRGTDERGNAQNSEAGSEPADSHQPRAARAQRQRRFQNREAEGRVRSETL